MFVLVESSASYVDVISSLSAAALLAVGAGVLYSLLSTGAFSAPFLFGPLVARITTPKAGDPPRHAWARCRSLFLVAGWGFDQRIAPSQLRVRGREFPLLPSYRRDQASSAKPHDLGVADQPLGVIAGEPFGIAIPVGEDPIDAVCRLKAVRREE